MTPTPKIYRQLFRTDGIRGRVNTWPITAQSVLRVALATGQYFRSDRSLHRVIIGKDTRLSGYMLETALTTGFLSMGMDVLLLGPLPTPAVAMLTKAMRADLGVMISASHNPHYDNGLKIFMSNGLKLSQESQQIIEFNSQNKDIPLIAAEKIGRAKRLNDAGGRYVEMVKQSLGKPIRLESLKIVLDCANGAAYKVAPLILWELGANVVLINNNPDGTNINKNCGALFPQVLQEAVIHHKADVGIALDGDADRLVLVNEKGKCMEGEQLLALIMTDMLDRGLLDSKIIVTTNMSSMAFISYCKKLGLKPIITPVGDRFISQAMLNTNARFGGESSGHIILADSSYCSDAMIAALHVLRKLKNIQQPLSSISEYFTPNPILNSCLPWDNAFDPCIAEPLKSELKAITDELGDNGKVVVRKSGTEPVLRILIECKNEARIQPIFDRIASIIDSLSTNKQI